MNDIKKIDPLPENGFHSFLILSLDNQPEHVIVLQREQGKTTGSMTFPLESWQKLIEETASQIHSVA